MKLLNDTLCLLLLKHYIIAEWKLSYYQSKKYKKMGKNIIFWMILIMINFYKNLIILLDGTLVLGEHPFLYMLETNVHKLFVYFWSYSKIWNLSIEPIS